MSELERLRAELTEVRAALESIRSAAARFEAERDEPDNADDLLDTIATAVGVPISGCKCGFRAPELGPHPDCPVHGATS